MSVDAFTQLFCIMGNPVHHSLSPVMHNRAFHETGYNGVYVAFQPEDIRSAVTAMRTLGIRGASITIPFKIDVLSCVDEIDPLAMKIGSANTLYNTGKGIKAFNTDGYGAIAALKEKNINLSGRRCLILGSGGAARPMAFYLADEGAEITISGIDETSARFLADELGLISQSGYIRPDRIDNVFMKDIDILINTTPVGMEPDYDGIPVSADYLHEKLTVFDIVYSPLETRLLIEAARRNCVTVSGLSMLLFQGARQFEIWTGLPAPIDAMRDSLLNAVHGK